MSHDFLPPFPEAQTQSEPAANIVTNDDVRSAAPFDHLRDRRQRRRNRNRDEAPIAIDPLPPLTRPRRRRTRKADGPWWETLTNFASKRLVIIVSNVAAIVICWIFGNQLLPADVAMILTNVVASVGGFKWRESYQGMHSTRLKLSLINTLTIVLNRFLPVPMSEEMIVAVSGVLVSIIVSDSMQPVKRLDKNRYSNEKENRNGSTT